MEMEDLMSAVDNNTEGKVQPKGQTATPGNVKLRFCGHFILSTADTQYNPCGFMSGHCYFVNLKSR